MLTSRIRKCYSIKKGKECYIHSFPSTERYKGVQACGFENNRLPIAVGAVVFIFCEYQNQKNVVDSEYYIKKMKINYYH